MNTPTATSSSFKTDASPLPTSTSTEQRFLYNEPCGTEPAIVTCIAPLQSCRTMTTEFWPRTTLAYSCEQIPGAGAILAGNLALEDGYLKVTRLVTDGSGAVQTLVNSARLSKSESRLVGYVSAYIRSIHIADACVNHGSNNR